MDLDLSFYQTLSREFYDRDTIIVAKELLGKFIIRKSPNIIQIGKIVEVEAYLGPHDLAAHSSKGMTKRTAIMFGPPGYSYIYLIYGIYHCLNFVTQAQGHASAVLIRAVEPCFGITKKTTGPGLLCLAMNIDKNLNGYDLLSDDFYVAQNIAEENTLKNIQIIERPRIGVDYAGDWAKKLLRFYIVGNKFISRK